MRIVSQGLLLRELAAATARKPSLAAALDPRPPIGGEHVSAT